jgi:hypothetical protein
MVWPDPINGITASSVRSPWLVCKSSNFAGSSVALTPLPESAISRARHIGDGSSSEMSGIFERHQTAAGPGVSKPPPAT